MFQKKKNDDHSYFNFKYKNKTYFLDVYLNTKLLPSGFTVTTFSLSGKPQTKKLDDQVSLKKKQCNYFTIFNDTN